jgi:hypothetical protein
MHCLICFHQEQICCCSTPGEDTKTESGDTKGSGLVGGHAYSLLDARDVQGHQLIRLRNPWGCFEWDGDFSDHSALWTEELKRAVQFEAKDDGSFWMCLRDFRKGFVDITACLCQDSRKQPWTSFHAEGFARFDAASGQMLVVSEYVLTITQPDADTWLGLLQPFERFVLARGQEPMDLGLVLLDQQGHVAFELPLTNHPVQWRKANLRPGTYRAVVHASGLQQRYSQPREAVHATRAAMAHFGVGCHVSDPAAEWRELPAAADAMQAILRALARDVDPAKGGVVMNLGSKKASRSYIFKHRPVGASVPKMT